MCEGIHLTRARTSTYGYDYWSACSCCSGTLESVCELLSKRNLQCMDPMIEAAKSGLAVNMASLPTLSAGGVSYAAGQQAPAEVVDTDRVQSIIARGREATFAELNSELKKQTELCKTNMAQFKAIGDVASFKRYYSAYDYLV